MSHPVQVDETAPLVMEQTADRVAEYRPGRSDWMPNQPNGHYGIDDNDGVEYRDWYRMRTPKGRLSIRNSGVVPDNSFNRWGDARGGPYQNYARSGNNSSNSISFYYDDLEVPTYKTGDRLFRYADGGIVRIALSPPQDTGTVFQSRPVDPDVPNSGTMHGSYTFAQAGITHAEASVMFKTWLQRTGSVNLYPMPANGGKLDGQFVGQGADGPSGMIGTWELPAGFFGVEDVREKIQGSFGADYAP